MERTTERFESLLNRYLDKSCSINELKELFSYVDIPEYKERLEVIMEAHYNTLVPETDGKAVDWDEMFNSIVEEKVRTKVASLWPAILSAAAIIIMLSVGILIWNNNQVQNELKIRTAVINKDIAPGGNKAILKLADGTEIVLDGHDTGILANENGTKISKTADGMLLYDASKSVGEESVANMGSHMNTLSTPRGGQYMLILPDRTKVWLNAESSISYPSVFSGPERNITLTGEAYFEVAKDKVHPFKVKASEVEVKVLGTHFNIMSYAEERQTQVSLAEGSVLIDLGEASKNLIPGQQASIKKGSRHISLRSLEIEEVIDWKNGLFQFDNTPLDQVMRQIKRWYNVEIIYEGTRPDIYITGIISRSNNVSKILALIEETGGVDFEIGNKQIIVKVNKRR